MLCYSSGFYCSDSNFEKKTYTTSLTELLYCSLCQKTMHYIIIRSGTHDAFDPLGYTPPALFPSSLSPGFTLFFFRMGREPGNEASKLHRLFLCFKAVHQALEHFISLWLSAKFMQYELTVYTLVCVHTSESCELVPSPSNMYIHMNDLSEVLHKYFLHRCRGSVLFSLKVGRSIHTHAHTHTYTYTPHTQLINCVGVLVRTSVYKYVMSLLIFINAPNNLSTFNCTLSSF